MNPSSKCGCIQEKIEARAFRLKKACFLLLFAAVLLLGATESKPPFTFVALGDNGCGCLAQGNLAQRLIQWHDNKPFDTVVMLGDNVYGGSTLGGSKNLFPDRFDKYYKPLVDKGVKFYATLGNHDVETNQGRDEIADKSRFHILGDQGYYWFSPAQEIDGKPLITFFVLNSEKLLKLNADKEQVAWLSKSLNESKALWKVVYFHEPIYAPGGAHEPAGDLKQGIEKVIDSAGVQLVLAGHDHFYARLKPQNGVNYMISGGGGRPLENPRESDVTAKVAREYHFIYFEVSPDQMAYTTVSDSGATIDRGMILQSMMPQPSPDKAKDTSSQ